MVNVKKVGIIGVGNVGASIAFNLIQKGLFSEMVLIDINKEKAIGEAMDLSHGLPYASPMDIYAGEYEDLKDASIIIITSGAAQKEGETRLDLINKNSKILKSVIDELNKINAEGILLIVSNPVDVLTHFAIKYSSLDKSKIIGSGTVLDTARLKYLLAKKLKVDSRNVHTVIIGEHGDSELAVNSISNVSGIPLKEFYEMKGYTHYEETMNQIDEDVKMSAYEIIKKKGSTYYGIAMAIGKICSAIVNDEKSMLPVSTELTGEYHLSNLALSVPCIIGKDGVEEILEMPLSTLERKELEKSANEIRKVIENVENNGD